jgi:hypothetical protein
MSVEASPDNPSAPPTGAAHRGSPDLPELRERHVALLTAWDGSVPRRDVADADALRAEVQAAGAWIEAPADRDAAQGIIDYWASAISAMPGQEFPSLLQLNPFDPENREAFVAHADDVLEALRQTDQEDIVRLVMLSMLPEIARLGGSAFSGAERDTLASPASDAVRDTLIVQGMARRLPHGEGAAAYALIHEGLLRKWPQLSVWLTGTVSETAKFDKAVAEAENWKYRDEAAAYLLRGRALTDAQPFVGRNARLTKLIDASLRARLRERLVTGGVAIGTLLAGYGLFSLGDSAGNATGYNDGFQIGRDAGEQIGSETLGDDKPRPPTQGAPTNGGSQAEKQFIWVGNARTPLLLDSQNHPVDPKNLQAGQTYRASTDIWLRADLPDKKEYRSSERVGVLPEGALVKALSGPNGFDRPSGEQYWLKVRRVTTVFIQYDDDTAAKANALRTALNAQGFDAKAVERQSGTRGRYQILYFYEADIALAQRLSDVMARLAPSHRGTRQSCDSRSHLPKRNPPGVIVIWVDLRSVEVAGAPAAKPEQRVSCVPGLPESGLRDAAL